VGTIECSHLTIIALITISPTDLADDRFSSFTPVNRIHLSLALIDLVGLVANQATSSIHSVHSHRAKVGVFIALFVALPGAVLTFA